MTISAGCYATSPTYNYIPQTTCTGSLSTSATSIDSASILSASAASVSAVAEASKISAEATLTGTTNCFRKRSFFAALLQSRHMAPSSIDAPSATHDTNDLVLEVDATKLLDWCQGNTSVSPSWEGYGTQTAAGNNYASVGFKAFSDPAYDDCAQM